MRSRFLAVATLLMLAISCGNSNNQPKELKRFALQGFGEGTTYSIVYLDYAENIAKSEIDSIINVFDYSCSIYNDSSLITALNRNLTDSLDQNIIECITAADSLSGLSGGLYDITIKPLTSALGFAAEERHKVNFDSIMEFIGYEKISIVDGRLVKEHPSIQLDLNSIAKGYSVDLVGRYLTSKGIENYIVEIGGEIYTSGRGLDRDWRVGIDKPYDGNFTPGANLEAVISLKNKALATSGNYRKFYTDDSGKRVNHTINPKTGESSINNMMSATVIADNCTYADGLATMMMVIGVERAISFLESSSNVDAYIVYKDGDSLKTYITPGAKAMLVE